MLVDSNTLLRTLQPRSPQHETARGAIKTLRAQGQKLSITPQNLIEIWVVATRPHANNGLGMSTAAAAAELSRLKSLFTILAETPALFPVWESLVIQYKVSGKPAHDARLVAAMRVHGLTSILTFDKDDFARYPGIEVVHPADVIFSKLTKEGTS
ncbi:MAG: type II toxin-antitoxin system VapC family toxin [Acidobacteriota bacterium]|nr:type II toxin-antitoxin system VapC family toxin [Acidobacteriota bacterium]